MHDRPSRHAPASRPPASRCAAVYAAPICRATILGVMPLIPAGQLARRCFVFDAYAAPRLLSISHNISLAYASCRSQSYLRAEAFREPQRLPYSMIDAYAIARPLAYLLKVPIILAPAGSVPLQRAGADAAGEVRGLVAPEMPTARVTTAARRPR